MGTQEITHNPGFYISLGVAALAHGCAPGAGDRWNCYRGTGKNGNRQGLRYRDGHCLCVTSRVGRILAADYHRRQALSRTRTKQAGQTRMVVANDGSCEISVPASWVNAPDLSKEAVLGAKDLTGNEYVIVFVHSKEDYTGGLDEFAKDHTDLLKEKLATPKAEPPVSILVNGRTAVRQIVRGGIDRMRITYRVTYYEGKDNFYRVFCWTLDSKAAAFAGDLDKVAESFREKVVARDADHS